MNFYVKSIEKINRLKQKGLTGWTAALLLIILCSFIYSWILSNQTMPYAEGWYSYYAKCILQGDVVYKDFEYLFTPIYMYMIAGIINIFGYKIIVLRIVGVLFFVVTAVILYLIFSQLFSVFTSFASTILAVFYMQSVNVCVFYDYIKLMDILALLTILFMLKTIGRLLNENKYNLNLVLWGLFNSLFILVKQNMGILFGVFSIVLLSFISIYMRLPLKKYVKLMLRFSISLFIPILILFSIIISFGAWDQFIHYCITGASEAKGGISVILFAWIKNGVPIFGEFLFAALSIIIFCVLEYFISTRTGQDKDRLIAPKKEIFLVLFYGLSILGAITLCSRNEGLGRYVSSFKEVNPYLVFLICFGLLLILFCALLYDILSKNKRFLSFVLLFSLLAAFFSISYGAGTSGGLSKSESPIGIGVIFAVLFEFAKFKYRQIIKIGLLIASFFITINCIGYKMVNSYNWWGQTEASLYESTEEVEIPALDGILVSQDTKMVYEEIYNLISEKTTSEDPIYCFPQIPIFYVLCDRNDPGTNSKVEWFDVSTKENILADMEIIERNPPKAILIYDLQQYVYDNHELFFKNNTVSGTTLMREFLYNFVYEQGYTYQGSFSSNSDKLVLYIKEEDQKNTSLFTEGDGTVDNPYIIDNARQLYGLSKQVNEGRSFEGQYISQTADIDLQFEEWIPIGLYDSGNYFSGTYNGNGHIISNLKIGLENSYNNGFFGTLEGTVVNVGIIGGSIEGDSCGVIASQSSSTNSKIINCFTDVNVSAKRAGGITDNFSGLVYNCFSVGELKGIESAGTISYKNENCNIENVINVNKKTFSEISAGPYYEQRVKNTTSEFLISDAGLNLLNSYVISESLILADSKYTLKEWEWNKEFAYPTLKSEVN